MLLGGARNRSRADFCGRETIGIMQRDVPRAFATLRESAQHDPFVIDVEALLDRGDGLEDVHFARPMPARAIDTAEAIELNLSLIGDVGGDPGGEEVADELGFGGGVLASVQPDVKTGRLAGIIVGRERHAVRKNRAVNLRGVGMNLLPALIPLRLIGLELPATLDALIERAEGMFDGGLAGEHVRIFEKHPARVRIDLDVAY